MQHNHGWLARLLITLLGGKAIATVLTAGGDGRITGDRLLLLAGGTLLWGALVLLPVTKQKGRFPPIAAPVVAGVAALILLVVELPVPELLPLTVGMALGVAVVTFGLSGLTALATRLGSDPDLSAWWVFCAAALAAAGPLWTGPLLEDGRFGQSAVNAVIAASPLSYLAVIADWDYLRGEWFYHHSPFGGLRYDYPSPIGATLVYLAIGLAGHCSGRPAGKPRGAALACLGGVAQKTWAPR